MLPFEGTAVWCFDQMPPLNVMLLFYVPPATALVSGAALTLWSLRAARSPPKSSTSTTVCHQPVQSGRVVLQAPSAILVAPPPPSAASGRGAIAAVFHWLAAVAALVSHTFFVTSSHLHGGASTARFCGRPCFHINAWLVHFFMGIVIGGMVDRIRDAIVMEWANSSRRRAQPAIAADVVNGEARGESAADQANAVPKFVDTGESGVPRRVVVTHVSVSAALAAFRAVVHAAVTGSYSGGPFTARGLILDVALMSPILVSWHVVASPSFASLAWVGFFPLCVQHLLDLPWVMQFLANRLRCDKRRRTKDAMRQLHDDDDDGGNDDDVGGGGGGSVNPSVTAIDGNTTTIYRRGEMVPTTTTTEVAGSTPQPPPPPRRDDDRRPPPRRDVRRPDTHERHGLGVMTWMLLTVRQAPAAIVARVLHLFASSLTFGLCTAWAGTILFDKHAWTARRAVWFYLALAFAVNWCAVVCLLAAGLRRTVSTIGTHFSTAKHRAFSDGD